MEFKRGDSFDFSGPVTIKNADGAEVTDLTGWTATSQIRDKDGELISDLEVTITDPATRKIRVRATGSTSDWTLGRAFTDIQFLSPDGIISSTQTREFEITEGPTR